MNDHDDYTRQIPAYTPPPKKRNPAKAVLKHLYRHLFLYFFLAVQLLFMLWLIVGVQGAPSIPAHCYDANGDVDIFKGDDCAAAAGGQTGTAIGAGLVFGLWVGTDIILGITRIIVLLSRRGGRKGNDK